MWSSLPPEVCAAMLYIFEPYTWVGVTVIFFNSWLEVLGVSDRPETS
jgi:hypothetical protein